MKQVIKKGQATQELSWCDTILKCMVGHTPVQNVNLLPGLMPIVSKFSKSISMDTAIRLIAHKGLPFHPQHVGKQCKFITHFRYYQSDSEYH